MRKYLVAQKMWTPVDVSDGKAVSRFILRHGTSNHSSGGKRFLIAATAIDASTWLDAYKQAVEDLIFIMDKLHVITQCVFSLAGASSFLCTQYDGAEFLVANIFRPKPVTGTVLWREEQFRDLARLDEIGKTALLYFRESGKASTAKTRLSMLLLAGEALAGEAKTESRCQRCTNEFKFKCENCGAPHQYSSTSKANLESIWGAELYALLYKHSKGRKPIRHQLSHGKPVDEETADEVAQQLYKRFRQYLQDQFNLESDVNILAAPRTLEGSEGARLVLRLKPGWMPLPARIEDIDWSLKFSELEDFESRFLGDFVEIPVDM